MYLAYEKNLRHEIDPNVIATLKRKGWAESFQPNFNPEIEYCVWDNGVWKVLNLPEAP